MIGANGLKFDSCLMYPDATDVCAGVLVPK
jgi:hypothetical protein